MTKDAFIREVRDAEAMLYHISKSILKNDSDYGMDLYDRINIDQVRYKDGTVVDLDTAVGGIGGGEEKQDKENGVLIIRNSFPKLVETDKLQAVHLKLSDQWIEVR